MSSHHKLSLSAAIFINMNIMLGSGIFINTSILAKQAGILGALSYALIGFLMLPLIISIGQLLKLHPAGGFYTFGAQEIHPFAGFLGTWGYATGKLASTVIMTHISMLLIQQIIPCLHAIPTVALDCAMLAFFTALNMFDIKTGHRIIKYFLGFKLIPIFFGILSGMYLFSGERITTATLDFASIPPTLPLVLFAIAGFEAACSLSGKIQDAHRNAPRAIFISYGIVIFLTTIFQTMLFSALGSELIQTADYRAVFPALLAHIFPAMPALQETVKALLHLAIASSALGGAYGILFSNTWNFYTLAQHNHLIGSSYFTRLNAFQIPWLCVLLEGALALTFLAITGGSQIPLQQIGALGSIIAYTMSALALLNAMKNRNDIQLGWWIPILSLGNCFILCSAAIYNLINNGAHSLITFGAILAVGIIMFFAKKFSFSVRGE